jgi:hydrogenase 3 maturation protease
VKQDLTAELHALINPPTLLLGIGHRGYGDDAAGVWLAESIGDRGKFRSLVCEELPENYTDRIILLGAQTILLLDAVDFNGQPGQVVLMKAEELNDRVCSSHHASLRPLMRYLHIATGAEVRLLGIQPAVLAPETGLSERVQKTLGMLQSLLLDVGTDEVET